MHRLDRLSIDDLVACSGRFRELGAEASTLEGVAQAIVTYLHEHLVDEDGQRACPLVRFYKTCRHRDLPPELQDWAGPVDDDRTPCLTLVGTAGEDHDWNDRRRSQGHQAIPLFSEEAVHQFPMIAGLIQQLGIDLSIVVAPQGPNGTTRRGSNLHHRDYDLFFVPEAEGSPLVPAQDDFVAPYGIRSVVGCGGMLPSGELFALILFTRLRLEEKTADLFRTLAISVKATVVPFTFEVFRAPGS